MTEPAQKPGRSKQDYATPSVFIEAVKKRLNIESFIIDLAADASNAKAPVWFDEEDDALSLEWGSQIGIGWGWLNPPFGRITPWAKKCAETVAATDARIAFLVPASVGSNWFRDHVYRAHAHTIFLNGRIAFDPERPTWGFPKDCMLVLFGLGYQGNEIWDWRTNTRY